MKTLFARIRWWLARHALGLDVETAWLVTDLARRDALPACEMAAQRLATKSLELRRERWHEEELCAMLLWLSRYMEEALDSGEVTGDDYPEHVVRGMVMKAATLVQRAYQLRSVREDQRYLQSSVFGGKETDTDAPIEPITAEHLVWLFGRVCLKLRKLPDGQVPAGIAKDVIEAYQAMCERYVRVADQETPSR